MTPRDRHVILVIGILKVVHEIKRQGLVNINGMWFISAKAFSSHLHSIEYV